jgi:hypothetical protein
MKVANLTNVQLDPAKVANGAPVRIETDSGEATIWVRRADARNVEFAKARSELAQSRDPDDSVEEFIEKVYPTLIARAGVVAWDGFSDAEGNPVPCDEKSVLEVFDNTDGIYEQVAVTASSAEAFRLEADTKSD